MPQLAGRWTELSDRGARRSKLGAKVFTAAQCAVHPVAAVKGLHGGIDSEFAEGEPEQVDGARRGGAFAAVGGEFVEPVAGVGPERGLTGAEVPGEEAGGLEQQPSIGLVDLAPAAGAATVRPRCGCGPPSLVADQLFIRRSGLEGGG